MNNLSLFRQNYRFLIVRLFFIIVVLIIGYKVIRIQFINPIPMPILSSGEYLTVIQSEVSRGKIFDSSGNLIADNQPQYKVQITPAELSNDDDQLKLTIEFISSTLGISKEKIFELLENNKKLDPFTPITIFKTLSSYGAIDIKWKTSTIKALDVVSIPQRIYTGGTLYSHILGH